MVQGNWKDKNSIKKWEKGTEEWDKNDIVAPKNPNLYSHDALDTPMVSLNVRAPYDVYGLKTYRRVS